MPRVLTVPGGAGRVTNWLRRVRGVVGTALAWAAAWAIPGLLAGVPLWILAGAISGAGFAVVFATAERQRRLEDLSLKRMAAWGALGAVVSAALATPLLVVLTGGALEIVPFLAAVTVLGAGSAVGTVAIAKRAAGPSLPGRRDRDRLP
jgi:hypothetical protein